MNIIVDILISIFLSVWGFINWFFQMKLVGDYPAFYSLNQLLIYLIALFLFALASLFHTKKTKIELLNITFMLPTIILWSLTLNAYLNSEFITYDTIAGFTGIVLLIGYCIINFINYRKRIKLKKQLH